jgi:hypothetical protein
VDFLDGELGHHLRCLDDLAEKLADMCERLAEGVDPQGVALQAGRRG